MKASVLKIIPQTASGTVDCLKTAINLPGFGALLVRDLLDGGGVKTNGRRLGVAADLLDGLDIKDLPVQPADSDGLRFLKNDLDKDGLLIVNARLDCRYASDKLDALLAASDTAVAVDIAPELAAPNELVRIGSGQRVVGFRRIAADLAEPVSVASGDWPALLYLPPQVCGKLSIQDRLPLGFEQLRQWLSHRGIRLRRFRLGGKCRDATEGSGVLHRLGVMAIDQTADDARIDASAKLIGPVWVGKGVKIAADAVIVGPAVLADGVSVERTATVYNTVAAVGVSIAAGQSVQNAVLLSDGTMVSASAPFAEIPRADRRSNVYRDWPPLSYPRWGKRIFDIGFSTLILMLISPVFLVVALMLKLTSPGPIFYVARRQGRYGREFGCLKFRSMMVQADTLQERLRVVNEVDGPQFKIDNDPRITGFGKFLRDTCIDELPQFINVLLGQMSVVGPRPSPESENETCPAWRDARLSVRPGITGLWQVCRTRQAGMDFQEWVYYDTQYVRKLSFRKDLWICLKTAQKLINTFLDQFG